MPKFLDFKTAYVEAMLFTDFHCDSEDLEHKDVSDFSPELERTIFKDCLKFWETIDPSELHCSRSEYTNAEQAGHDFWLTRNGHGAGFWDGDWPEPQATVLTDLSTSFGPCELYAGDEGKVYS